jgi:hypothetical protein
VPESGQIILAHAGRTVAFPADLVPELRWHLERFSESGPRGLVFIGPKGAPLRRSNFRRICSQIAAGGNHWLLTAVRGHLGGTPRSLVFLREAMAGSA